MLVKCQRPAMATEFAIWLVGDDEESLTAIGEAALDEVERVETVLSRFDPTAELARFNRHAAKSRDPMKLSVELFKVLQRCVYWWKRTDGFFDIAWRWPGYQGRHKFGLERNLGLDPVNRTAWRKTVQLDLDLGGFGKGYALDCAMKIVRQFDVRSALIHGGTSSVLSMGGNEYGDPWPIDLRDPMASSPEFACGRVYLRDDAISSSAEDWDGQAPVAACTVVCDSAADAEAYSTALLDLGKERAKEYLGRIEDPPCAVAWIENDGSGAKVDWLVGSPHA